MARLEIIHGWFLIRTGDFLKFQKGRIMEYYILRSTHRQPEGIRHRRLLYGLCLVLLFIALGPACRPKTAAEPDPNTPGADHTRTVDSLGDGVAVTVNGVDITEGQVQALVKPELEKIAAKTAQLPPTLVEQYEKDFRQWALDKLITEHLLAEQVKKANIVVTEEEVLSRIRETAAAQKPPLSLQEYKQTIEDYGQSFDEHKDELRKQLAYWKLMDAGWAKQISITEEDARRYYSENVKRFETPEQVRASHILIKPKAADPNVDPNEAKTRAKAKAQDLLEQIKGGGDFAELAKAHSDCRSAASGGDLDFFSRGEMEAPFENAAFELKAGQVSDVVETTYGYHIIKVTDRKGVSVTPFEQVKDTIIDELTQKRRSELAKKYIESLKAKAAIVYPPGRKPRSPEPTFPGSSAGG
jgi:peptidyl-prolyl cis-trans isomerase C